MYFCVDLEINSDYFTIFGPGSSVGIATDYGLDDTGIEPW
jgi:hypothetical protein